jgi:hypothetical protein
MRFLIGALCLQIVGDDLRYLRMLDFGETGKLILEPSDVELEQGFSAGRMLHRDCQNELVLNSAKFCLTIAGVFDRNRITYLKGDGRREEEIRELQLAI